MKILKITLIVFILFAWCFLIPEPTKEKSEKEEEKVVMETTEKSSKKDKEKFILVRTTYYHPVESQCDSDPLITADGSKIDKSALLLGNIRWIAISRDLLVEYPLGTKVRVTSEKYPEISGLYEIHDVMNQRFRYSIDVLSHEDNGHIFGTHLTKLEKV